MKMRPEMMLLLLVAYFLVFLLVRKYVSSIFWENAGMLEWQNEYSHGRDNDGAKDTWKQKFSFCKNIEGRKIQVT